MSSHTYSRANRKLRTDKCCKPEARGDPGATSCRIASAEKSFIIPAYGQMRGGGKRENEGERERGGVWNCIKRHGGRGG